MEATQMRLEEQALEWLLRLESDESPRCHREFLEWCEQSRAHVQAFLEATALDRQLDRALVDIDAEAGADVVGEIDLEALIEEVRASRPENVLAFSAPSPDSTQGVVSRKRRIGLPVAAVLAGILATVAAWRAALPPSPIYVTQVGEQRSIKLSDGSMVHLNTHSRIEERYTESDRDVDLLEGEALFVVAHDRNRPFRVSAGDATVLAVGTQFNVYRQAGRTTVAVLEGKVRVEADAKPVALSAGEAAHVVAGGRIVKEDSPEVTRATAWRHRQLDFRRASISEVAAQFNRYNLTQVVIEDPEVGERLMNGVFDADSPQQLMEFLQEDESLEVTLEDGVVRVSLARH
jgi:transmembrane sensor